MARRGLDLDERQRLFAESLSSEDSGVPPAIRFQLLTGLTVFELCALNTDDLVAGKYVSWIEIVKEYKQGRGKEPIMTKLLSDANAYRRVVCTDTVLDLLRDQIAGQKKLSELGQVICEPGKQADKPVIPLFTNRHGVRMQPEEYKRQVREILVRIIKDGAHLSFRERAPVLGVDTTMASTDILRGTAEHVFRVRCGMAPSEIEAIMGRYRLNTLAIYYIDWGNELKMLYTKHQLERWHSQMNDEHAYQHLLYCTVTCPKDTTLTLYAEHGYKGQVSVS